MINSQNISSSEVRRIASVWCDRLGVELNTRALDILRQYDISWYTSRLAAYPLGCSYSYIPDDIRQASEQIQHQWGGSALSSYHKLALARLLRDIFPSRNGIEFPESVCQIVNAKFSEILADFERRSDSYYLYENDLFAKDLAIARQKLVPCGSEFLDVCSGFPRRTLFQGGIAQFLSGTLFTIGRLRGFSPLFESHWDKRLLSQFDEDSFNVYYNRVAEMLKLNPKVKGLLSASWWLDPILESISPKLGFLRAVPQQNGAHLFRVGTNLDSIRDATKYNMERNRLFKQGRYTPMVYMLVWPRQDLICWSCRHAKKC